ncbi:MAG: (deoxy)nucleoside triphosphate pyrophosphohydrolase [Polyangiaceae bacterium]|jgi:8-oxo-dGTP diphosphatase|nr:(deoxy)nucleoside triphosphate pyrophosphohydrolase [Polyangiaceae bacterium]
MTLIVVAAVMIHQHRVLVTQRPAGSHLAGMWEFPGGKVEPDEDPRDALVRELAEELAIAVSVHQIVDVIFHRYPQKNVLLLFYETSLLPASPLPQPVGVADLCWRAAHELHELDFPPADVAILQRVRNLLAAAP